MKVDSRYIANPNSLRKVVTKIGKSGAILPVVLLEATVTGGRTYQAYQRGGFVEARERVTEESLGAVFWLFGATMFGKLFDFIGQKALKVPKDMPDCGKDSVRTAFDNYIDAAAKRMKLTPEMAEKYKTKLARFSVGKTAASIITACAFIGYVVPKLNQGITKHIYGKLNNNPKAADFRENDNYQRMTLRDFRSISSAKGISINAVENFKANKDRLVAPNTVLDTKTANQSKVNNSNPSFKGSSDSLLRIVQNFEENDIWKLMGTDVGTVGGRTTFARNNDERVEIAFRDLASIPFYCFTTPMIISFMNKHDTFKGLNTRLNPMSAMEVHNELVQQMANLNKSSMSVQEFRKFALGEEKIDTDLFNKLIPQKSNAKKNIYSTVELSKFNSIVDEHVKDASKAQSLKELAERMSQLQPQRRGISILTESQVEDVLRGGAARKPEFMKTALNNIFKTKNSPNRLTDAFQYIQQSKIEEKRSQILDYVESIIKEAEMRKGDINFDSMLKMNKRNLTKNGLFMGVGLGISALFLSTIIPKIQYFITKVRTGKDSFPGTENMNK